PSTKEGNVRVESRQPRQEGNQNAEKRRQRLPPEACEAEIEPDHIGPLTPNHRQQSPGISPIVKLPAANYRESVQLRLSGRTVVAEDCQADARNALQFPRNMVAVLVQRIVAGRK